MSAVHAFIESLYARAQRRDRAALANLRRGLGDPLAALPYVVPFLAADAPRSEEDALVAVAGLFALHPQPGPMTLAQALRLLRPDSDSIEQRFRALIDSDPEDLPTHLRHAVGLARSRDLGLDYEDLLWTILAWGREDQRRQRAWARDFWGRREPVDAHENEEERT